MTKGDSPRSFFAELKRRRVYRVGAFYAAVAFVLWQAADIAVPALGLPPVVMRVIVVAALAGFPIALLLAWVYEITPDGIRSTRVLDALPGPDRESLRHRRVGARARWVSALLAIPVILAGAWWMLSMHLDSAPIESGERAVVIFPFTVQGGSSFEYLGDGMVELLGRNIAGPAAFEPLDASLIMSMTGGDPVSDVERARQLAGSAGAARFILGSITEAGDQLRIDAALHPVERNGIAPHVTTVQGDTTAVFALLDELSAKLLTASGMGAASEQMLRTAARTSGSLTALKHYLEGEQHFRLGEQEKAIAAFREAVGEDPTFALAHYRLALAHHMRREHAFARRVAGTAVMHSDRLGPRDQAVIGAFHDYQAGRIDTAERTLRAVTAEYRTDLEARLILAEILLQYAPVRGRSQSEARGLFEELIEADPRFLCIRCRLLNVALFEGDIDRAEFWAQQEIVNESATGQTTRNIADRFHLAARRGDAEAMRTIADEAAQRGGERMADQLVSRFAITAMMSGDFRMGDELLALGEELGASSTMKALYRMVSHLSRGQYSRADEDIEAIRTLLGPGPSLAMRANLLLVNAPSSLRLNAHDVLVSDLQEWTLPDVDNADGAFPAERIAPATRHYLLGLALSRTGQADAALAEADSLDGLAERLTDVGGVVRDMAQTVRADVVGRQGDWAATLEAVETVGREVPPELLGALQSAHEYAAELRVTAHFALDEPAEALRWLRFGVRSGDLPRAGHYGIWHAQMAKAHHALEQEDEAREHFQRLAEAWQDADPEQKARVEALRGQLADP